MVGKWRDRRDTQQEWRTSKKSLHAQWNGQFISGQLTKRLDHNPFWCRGLSENRLIGFPQDSYPRLSLLKLQFGGLIGWFSIFSGNPRNFGHFQVFQAEFSPHSLAGCGTQTSAEVPNGVGCGKSELFPSSPPPINRQKWGFHQKTCLPRWVGGSETKECSNKFFQLNKPKSHATW